MKKIIPTAILIAGFPALLSAQGATCEAATCQLAPYFEGTGGFVGDPARVNDPTTDVDESEVTFIVTCGNVTVRGTVTPDAGVVRQALTVENGFACAAEEGGTIEIDGLKDGGWYWINDDRSSAVTALIRKDSLGHPRTIPTDPGGIVLKSVEGGAATFAKHEPSGRVGIIPHIVPGKPVPDCSGVAGSDTAIGCVLGTPDDWLLTTRSSSVTRPTGGDPDVEVTVTLTGTRFITTGTVAATATLDIHTSVVGVVLSAESGAPPAMDEPGVLEWVVTVAADSDRCVSTNPDRMNEQTVTVEVASADEVIPGLPTDGVETSFTVNCAALPAASQGVELAPGNPFPVD